MCYTAKDAEARDVPESYCSYHKTMLGVAETGVLPLIADNHSEGDIIHGLNKSIAAKTVSMVSRAKGQGPDMKTGGVARNQGVVKALESRLGQPLFITENPDLMRGAGRRPLCPGRDLRKPQRTRCRSSASFFTGIKWAEMLRRQPGRAK